MKTSDNVHEILPAFIAAQSAMGGAVKDAANPFYSSKYADFTAVLKAVKRELADNGLGFMQFPINHPETRIPGIRTRIVHTSGQWLEDEFYLTPVKNDPQQMGSAITYMRRYTLQAIFGVPAVDDDAELAMERDNPEPAYEQEPLNPEQCDEILGLCMQTGTNVDDFVKWLGYETLVTVPASQYQHAMQALNAKLQRVNNNA